jgi:hypothetical protein
VIRSHRMSHEAPVTDHTCLHGQHELCGRRQPIGP